MHERLKEWMIIENLKSSDLANIIGASRATISHILSGRNKPSIDFLRKLLDHYPTLNINWLITGIGYVHQNFQKEINNKLIDKVVVFYDDSSFEEVKS